MSTPIAADRPLTERQRAVLRFIIAAIDERGYPPGYREVSAFVGSPEGQPCGARCHITVLTRKGYLAARPPGRGRALVPLRHPDGTPWRGPGPAGGPPPSALPSPRQAEALRLIADTVRDSGRPPTVRELAAALGITSTNAVNDLLRALERKGWIRRPGHHAGGRLRVLHELPEAAAPEGRS